MEMESHKDIGLIQIKAIGAVRDINTVNQSFKVLGRILPVFDGENQKFTETLIKEPFEYKPSNKGIAYTEYINI